MAYKCIIADDDELDRLMLKALIKKYPTLLLEGIFSNAEKILDSSNLETIDILFLDIDMPGMNGLELRRKLLDIPVCIFISAHPEFAIESFALDTLDFISKPLTAERFQQAYERIVEYLELKQKARLYENTIGGDSIIIKEGYKQTKIKLHEILYLEALKDYTKIITRDKRHIVLSSIGSLLKEPHFQSFVRIHRSFAVQKNYILKIGSQQLELSNNKILPIGKNYKNSISL